MTGSSLTQNHDLLGAAGETHGLTGSTRSYPGDHSAPVLDGVGQAPPDYHPSEPMRHSIVPVLPPSSTQARPDDFSLPHDNDPNLYIEKKIKATRVFNPLHLETDQPRIDPAHNHATSGDTRNEVVGGRLSYTPLDGPMAGKDLPVHGGGIHFDKGGPFRSNGVFMAHGGNFADVDWHRGEKLKPGDNQSAEMVGGNVVKSVLNAGDIFGGSFLNDVGKAIGMGKPSDAQIDRDNKQEKFNQKHLGGGSFNGDIRQKPNPFKLKEKHSELMGGGLNAKTHMPRFGKEKGGKNKFWKDFANNLTGTALNLSKIAATAAETEGGAIEKKKQKKAGKIKSPGDFFNKVVLGQNPVSKEGQKFAPLVLELA